MCLSLAMCPNKLFSRILFYIVLVDMFSPNCCWIFFRILGAVKKGSLLLLWDVILDLFRVMFSKDWVFLQCMIALYTFFLEKSSFCDISVNVRLSLWWRDKSSKAWFSVLVTPHSMSIVVHYILNNKLNNNYQLYTFFS